MTPTNIPSIYRVRYTDESCFSEFEDFWSLMSARDFFDSIASQNNCDVYLMMLRPNENGRWDFESYDRKFKFHAENK